MFSHDRKDAFEKIDLTWLRRHFLCGSASGLAHRSVLIILIIIGRRGEILHEGGDRRDRARCGSIEVS